MDDILHTRIENTKLSPWYFAVNWAVITLQQKVALSEERGFDTAYDIRQLQQLEDLQQFLKMSWDQWLDAIEARQTDVEVK